MATDCIALLTFRFQRNSKPRMAAFDMAHASSDGGAIVLKAIDRRLGLTERLAVCATEWRTPGKVQHSILALLRHRVFGLALGYPDDNDAARLAHDPIHKLLLDRDPLTGAALGSQPTLSRFENSLRRADLYAMADTLADVVIATQQHRRAGPRVRRITLDQDTTEDPTHGQQQFALFNGYYDTWCYLPLLATQRFDNEAQQYLVASVQLFGETRYQTRKWSRKRRIVMKAEVLRYPGRAPKNNPRLVVTNLPDPPPAIYACYAARGDMENRVKELKLGLALDRTGCSRFPTNQFRVLLTAAAYVLFQELQRHAPRTAAVAQVSTLRERLLKLDPA